MQWWGARVTSVPAECHGPLAKKDPNEVIANITSDLPEEYAGLWMNELLNHKQYEPCQTDTTSSISQQQWVVSKLLDEERAHHGRFQAQTWW